MIGYDMYIMKNVEVNASDEALEFLIKKGFNSLGNSITLDI